MPVWKIHDENDRVMLVEIAPASGDRPAGISVHLPSSGPPLILDIETAQELRNYLGAAIREAQRQ